MGDGESLQRLQEEIQRIGQAFYSFQRQFEQKSQEFYQQLDWLDSEIKRKSVIEQEYRELQYRVDRHRDFNEPLDRI